MDNIILNRYNQVLEKFENIDLELIAKLYEVYRDNNVVSILLYNHMELIRNSILKLKQLRGIMHVDIDEVCDVISEFELIYNKAYEHQILFKNL